jgi:hypothetical protein
MARMPPAPDPQRRPAIRGLDVQRVAHGREVGIVLTDRLGLGEPTFLPEALLPIVGRCDGTKTLAAKRAPTTVRRR